MSSPIFLENKYTSLYISTLLPVLLLMECYVNFKSGKLNREEKFKTGIKNITQE